MIFSALWTNEPACGDVLASEVQRVISGDGLHYLKPAETEELKTPESIFNAYDQWQAKLAKNDHPIDGVKWGVTPNIYSAEGLAKLAAMAPKAENELAGEASNGTV